MKRHRRKLSSGTNFWPGYVDALTNVVLNLLFMVALFGITIAVFNKMPGSRLAPQADASKALLPVAPLIALPPIPPPALQLPETIAPSASPMLMVETDMASDGADLVVADAYERRGGPNVRVTRRLDVKGQMVLTFDLAVGSDPLVVLARPSLRGKLMSTLVKGQSIRLWTSAERSDVGVRRVAYTALITLRNQLISMGYSPTSIDVRVYEGSASSAAGMRLYLISTP